MAENQLRELALVGAQARLQALQAEMAALLATFPELRGGRAVRASAASAPATRGRGGRKRPMSAAEKKVVSERMKKYLGRTAGREGCQEMIAPDVYSVFLLF